MTDEWIIWLVIGGGAVIGIVIFLIEKCRVTNVEVES